MPLVPWEKPVKSRPLAARRVFQDQVSPSRRALSTR
jgi:hypothetical protein